MLYNAYNKQCRLKLHLIFGTEYGLRAEYQEGEEWVYISEPTFFASELTTKEETDVKYQEALDVINAKMEQIFGEVTEPDNGVERIQWLMDNRTVVIDNNLRVKHE